MSNASCPPVFAVCGWSGSGKTTLLEHLIRQFQRQGYRVGVIKHDSHSLELDREGKNTARLWEAGSEMLLAHDAGQLFLRAQKHTEADWQTYPAFLAERADFILVEGHKNTPFPKLWLHHPQKIGMPDDLTEVVAALDWVFESRLERARNLILDWYHRQFQAQPVRAGLLIGGLSSRMGQDKPTLIWKRQTLLDALIDTITAPLPELTLLGNRTFDSRRSVPQLPDAPGCAGPLAGILSALRWDPQRPWFFTACDLPFLSGEMIRWLLAQRKPGYWAVVPESGRLLHPLCAIYEPQMKPLLENAWINRVFSLRAILQHPKVLRLAVPQELQAALQNCNTPEEWERVKEQE